MPRRADRYPPGMHVPTRGGPPAAKIGSPAHTVGDLAEGDRLSVQCARCRHAALIDARWLRARRPAAEPLAQVARRCRCTACGHLGTTWWSVVAAG